MIKAQKTDWSDKQKTASPLVYGTLKEYADHNRKNPTEAEWFLWQNIKGKQLGVKFRRQHAIDEFIADFACLEESLVIEVDGGYHNDPLQQEADARRSFILEELGYRILRFTNEQVLYDIDSVLSQIRANIIFTEIEN